MTDDKKDFSTLKSTLILIQQLQAKYYGKVGIDIDTTISKDVISVRVGGEEHSSSVFFRSDSEISRGHRHRELLSRINSQL